MNEATRRLNAINYELATALVHAKALRDHNEANYLRGTGRFVSLLILRLNECEQWTARLREELAE